MKLLLGAVAAALMVCSIYKTTDVVTTLQGLVNSGKAVVISRASWRANVAADIDEWAKQGASTRYC